MSWAEIKKAVNSDLSKPLNVKIDELAEPGMFGMDVISGLRFLRGVYPYHNGAADITINEDTTWDDIWGFKRVGKLTIAAGKKLTIARFPFFILADEIEFGDVNSWICADGPSGAATGAFPETYSRGGTAESGAVRAQGGCGGGLLFVLCNSLSGADGKITANGGNGFAINENSGATRARGGQGALSFSYDVSTDAELWDTESLVMTFALLANGGYHGGVINGGTGGGSGRGSASSYSAGGGSGIGGGAGAHADPNNTTRAPGGSLGTRRIVTPGNMLTLAVMGCRGGGGGGAALRSSTSYNDYNHGGGGGGGGVVVFYRTKNNFVVEANGGLNGGNSRWAALAGGAGITMLLEVEP